jgi:signal transduction histidine kinase
VSLKPAAAHMLDLAKIERRKATLVKQMVNIKSLVEDVVSDFELKTKARGLRLRCEFPPNEITAFIDQEKIIQVLSNLISNAIKYTERGHILVSIAEKDNFVECHVSDTGKGIAEKDLPKLFNKFEQVARQLTLAEKGTGLGLAISKRIVQLHGGKIYAASAEGKGSTFTFTMPMWSLKKGTVRDLKGLFSSAINEFNQFSIIKLVDLQEQPLTIQTPLLYDVIVYRSPFHVDHPQGGF